MIQPELEESKKEEAKSQFLLTSSIYRRCCTAHCDDFLKLFVNDQLAQKFYSSLQQHGLPLLSSSSQPAEPILVSSSSPTTPDNAEAQPSTSSPAIGEVDNMEDRPISMSSPVAKSDNLSPNPSPHSVEGDEEKEKKEMMSHMPGCRLSNLLMAVLLADVSIDIQMEVGALLLGAFHAADSVDAVFQSIPSIQTLFDRVKADQEQGLFLDKQFSTYYIVPHHGRCTTVRLSSTICCARPAEARRKI